MLTEHEIEIRGRLSAVTPGSWSAAVDAFDDAAGAARAASVCLLRGGDRLHIVIAGISAQEARRRADEAPPETDVGTKIASIVGNGANSGNNAAFIAAAPGDVAYLLGEVERLRMMLVEIAKASPDISEHIAATLAPLTEPR